MGILWKKESTSGSVDAQFVNLFTWEKEDEKPKEVLEWDRKIESGEWKHQFSILDTDVIRRYERTVEAVKSKKNIRYFS